MRNTSNYIECAKNNESVFRMILDKYNKTHQDLTIEEIHEKYSQGNRRGIWTILDFKELSQNVFEFSSENIRALSGRGSTERYSVEDGKLKHIGSGMIWMS